MDTSDQHAGEPETTPPPLVTPPSAMPLSMPPVTVPMPVADSTAEVPVEEPREQVTAPVGAMPLSMPPYVAPTAERPVVGVTGGGGVPPISPPWVSPSAWPPGPLDAPVSQPGAKRPHRAVAALLAASLAAGGLGAGLGVASSSGGSGPSTNALASPSKAVPQTKALSAAEIYKLVTPAVVDITTNVATQSSAGSIEQAAGTGMIVSSDGLILTNNHVIKSATSIKVAISGASKLFNATVVGTSVNHDIALLKVSGVSGLPTVDLGNSSTVAVGDTAVAVGNAQGLGGNPSLASGSISALGRTISAANDNGSNSETLTNLIETNAGIQPGDSGGPLLNAKGQVIGMDTAASTADTASTLGFAIPINQAKSIALAIENGIVTKANGVRVGLTPYLGVVVDQGGFSALPSGFGFSQCANGGEATPPAGARISDVIINGPAANAKLAGGDTITSVGGKVINGTGSTAWANLTKVIGSLKAGEKLPVAYTDACGTAHTVSVTIGGIPA